MGFGPTTGRSARVGEGHPTADLPNFGQGWNADVDLLPGSGHSDAMTVENATQIDAIGIETSTGKVVLTISDHLDWSQTPAHLQVIESKVNAYLAFVQGPQLIEVNPDARDRQVKIAIYQAHPEPEEVTPIFNKLAQQLGFVGIELWRGFLPAGY